MVRRLWRSWLAILGWTPAISAGSCSACAGRAWWSVTWPRTTVGGILRLSATGAALAAEFDQRSQDEVTALLETLPEARQHEFVTALQTACQVLTGEPVPVLPVVLRGHRPGDMGWVVEAHGRLYAVDNGWDDRFEALIAEIVSVFLRNYDPIRERCWIAEQGGVRVGSVFVVRQDDEIAKLRLLLVDPAVRGVGLGQTLVHECVVFARAAGYRTLRLWTNDVQVAARRIYEREGFRLVASEPHADFGIPIVGETWEITL